MTEDEAKQKWCPFVRVTTVFDSGVGRPLPAFNRMVTITKDGASNKVELPVVAVCVGSSCMAWRWQTLTVWPDDPAKQPTAHEDETDGYCGLAGRP